MSRIFETERLIVRLFTEADQNNFYHLNGNPVVVRYIREPKSREECDAFLVQIMEDARLHPLYGRWAVVEKLTGSFVGSFAIIPVDETEEMQLGYALLTEHWGKGFATELSKGGLEYVFGKTPLELIHAYVEKPNIASRMVLLKSGFRPNGEKKEKKKILDGFVIYRWQWMQKSL